MSKLKTLIHALINRPRIVHILIDNSGSMKPNTVAICDAVNAIYPALRGSDKETEVFITIRFLNGGQTLNYLVPHREAKGLNPKLLNPIDRTPLIDRLLEELDELQADVEMFEEEGAPPTATFILFTDGADDVSQHLASDARKVVEKLNAKETYQLYAMGLTDGTTDFQKVFSELGFADGDFETVSDPQKLRAALCALSAPRVKKPLRRKAG